MKREDVLNVAALKAELSTGVQGVVEGIDRLLYAIESLAAQHEALERKQAALHERFDELAIRVRALEMEKRR